MALLQWSSWTAPLYMALSLMTGILLAAGHHLFYAGLAGSEAPTGVYNIAGTDVSKQQFNTAVGTTFAFLVKASLTLAVSIAYTQAFWHAAKGSANGRQLSTLDTIYSVLSNVLAFAQVHVWVKYPLLFGLAIIVWLVPLASIVTPATLSVQTAPQTPAFSHVAAVPQLGFSSMNYIAPMPLAGLPSADQKSYTYAGPSQVVQRVATAVGAQGRMLNIPIQAPNASWSLDFSAPSLQCDDVVGQEREAIWANIFEYLVSADGSLEHCDDSPAYIAWLPSPGHAGPYDIRSRNETNWGLRKTNETTSGSNMFYVTFLPWMVENNVPMATHTLPGGCMLGANYRGKTYYQALNDERGWINSVFGNSTLLQCGFRNASYLARFKVENGQQEIELHIERSHKLLQRLTGVTGPRSLTNGGPGDFSIPPMQAADPNCSTLNLENKDCVFDIDIANRLSFQAVSDAFTGLVTGQIGLEFRDLASTPSVQYNSDIVKTTLMDTELALVRTWALGYGHDDLTAIMATSNGTDYIGLSNNKTTGSRGLLGPAMEDMFTNITISLMSEPNLWPNYTSGFSPTKLVNVTYPGYENVYVYAQKTLWIAYGLAIAFSLLAVLLGVVVLCLNGAAYDASFSTVLRVSRTARMTEEVRKGEGDGSLPLPRHLAKARVVFGDGDDRSSGSEKGGLDVRNEERPDTRSDPSVALLENESHSGSWRPA